MGFIIEKPKQTSFCMNTVRLLVIGILILSIPSWVGAQKNKRPDATTINFAKAQKAEHSKDNLLIRNSLVTYTFDFNERTKKVTVLEKNKRRYICLAPQHKTSFVNFYNQESEIKSIEVFNAKGKRVPVYPKDDYYQDSDFFYSDARVIYFNLEFPYQGSEYQVNYTKKYKDVKYFTSSFFSNYYPNLNKKIRFVVPDWLEVEFKEMNFDNANISVEKEYNESKKSTTYTFTGKKFKSENREEYAPGPSHIYPHLLVLTKSYTRQGKKVALFDSTQDLYDWYKSLVDLIDDDISIIKAKVETLTAGLDTDIEKVKAIYYWVQDNIRYIAFEDGLAGFKPEECHKVFQNKYGDCKGMANLTKQMLILAGFDARLTWIGTKRIAYDYSLPTLAADNHMICTVIIDGKKYFLDPTEKYNTFNVYAERIQGKQALIENGDGFMLELIPEMNNETNEELIVRKFKIDGDVLKGEGHHSFKGESKSKLLYSINHIKSDRLEEALDNYIKEGDKNLRVFDTKTTELNQRDQDFLIDYSFEQKNAVSSFGEEMYLDLDYYKEMEKFKFDGSRQFDYLFPYKTKLVVKTELEIPHQYQVQEMPSGLTEDHENFSFHVKFKKDGNKLIYEKEINIDEAVIRKEDLELWDSCIDKLDKVYHQQLILTKKQ